MKPIPLQNNGNICCYNSVFQSIMHTPALRQGLKHILKQLETDPDHQEPRVRLMTLYGKLLQDIDGKDRVNIKAADYLGRAQGLERGVQHDALEIYEKFLAQIEREVANKEQIIQTPRNYHKLVDKCFRSWEMSWRAHATKTTLMALTNAYQIDQYRCLCCKRRIHSTQLYNSIRLQGPANAIGTTGPMISVQQLLDEYLQEKEQDDLRTCDGCKSQQKMSLATRFYRAPEVLVLAIQRTSGYSTVKNPMPVDIPDVLDFQPALIEGQQPKLYKLSSVVMHHGSRIDHGHYTALVRTSKGFVIMDDDRATPYDPAAHQSIVQRDAYLLFYSSL